MDHPVWEVYNEYRTARLNVKYYSAKLASLQRRNLWIEWLLAAASSSTVAGLWFFQTMAGEVVWKLLGSVAAMLAVYQPIAKLAEQIRRLEERVTAYRGLELDLERLSRKIAHRGAYDDELIQQFEALMDQKGEVVRSYIDPKVDEKLQEKCEAEVLDELPVSRFLVPEEVTT